MINFCTLFNSNYLTRGLALYESLQKVCSSFHLYVVAFDQNAYEYLNRWNFPHLTAISLQEFEDDELLKIKVTRSPAEYCWTCTPSVILYCIERFNIPSCTYVDADMIFYNDPEILLQEVKDHSILLTEHAYSKEYDQSAKNGKYCVQFMWFKNDKNGLDALGWWRERCLEWCYARLEDGKFGDQKYLDDWTSRFSGVYVLEHPGGGVAPWNAQQYSFSDNGEYLTLTEKKSGKQFLVIFFHFHGLKFYSDHSVACSESLYDLNDEVRSIIYFPYIRRLHQIKGRLVDQGIKFNVDGATMASPSKPEIFRQFVKERLSLWKAGKISPFQLNFSKFGRHHHFYKLEFLIAK